MSTCPARHTQTRERCARPLGHDPPHELPYKHRCHAKGCVRPCKPEHLMCSRHWAMVPRPLQDEVYRTYRPGQCDDKQPSEAWHKAADAAIKAVWEKELPKHLKTPRQPDWACGQIGLPGIEP